MLAFRWKHCLAAVAALVLFVVLSAAAETKPLLILHTNDLHDHVRPGYEGAGGLPYVAGYIAKARAGRRDVLLLDGGDVTEKGDLVAFSTESKITYTAMGTMHYDAVTLGNHDFSHGLAALKEKLALLNGATAICANAVDEANNPIVPASTIKDVNGLKVGIIGAVTNTDDAKTLNLKETAKVIAAEANRLDEECQVVMVVAHLGKNDCLELAKAAPAVDIFVGGHTHELLREPVRAPESGALIVQAGDYAENVGRLEVAVDADTEQVTLVKGEVVSMDHQKTPCDKEMLAMVREREAAVCPDAARVLGRNPEVVMINDMARLAAAALRNQSGADLAFCHPGQVLRSPLPAGEIDVNAVFRTGGQRGNKIVRVELPGKAVVEYLDRLAATKKGMTMCAGVDLPARPARGTYAGVIATDRNYSVVMPEIEWLGRFTKLAPGAAKAVTPAPCDFSFTGVVSAYVEEILASGGDLAKYARNETEEKSPV